mmetsp:Transcript_16957/g.38834  ORF Transcript_16957/g.38834 Transcript_16957/m.38834 type:complete len:200 (-) Transcript_16957:435-1034(-)
MAHKTDGLLREIVCNDISERCRSTGTPHIISNLVRDHAHFVADVRIRIRRRLLRLHSNSSTGPHKRAGAPWTIGKKRLVVARNLVLVVGLQSPAVTPPLAARGTQAAARQRSQACGSRISLTDEPSRIHRRPHRVARSLPLQQRLGSVHVGRASLRHAACRSLHHCCGACNGRRVHGKASLLRVRQIVHPIKVFLGVLL